MTRKAYRKGEVLAKKGARLDSLMVIRSGVVVVSRREHDQDVKITRLAPGDYFGESGLFTGAGEAGTCARPDARRGIRDGPGGASQAHARSDRASPTRSA